VFTNLQGLNHLRVYLLTEIHSVSDYLKIRIGF